MIFFIPLCFLFYVIPFLAHIMFIYTPSRIERGKSKGLLQQAEVAQGVPGRLRPRIFLTFGTTRLVCRQPYAPAAFTPGESPVLIFRG
jgi:hypothetical protein